MEANFWIKRWEDGKIGFHQPEVHPFLEKFFPELGLSSGEKIFVPLCGKSLDMVWLSQKKGLHVLGVELAEIAVHDFFHELGVTPKIEVGDRHRWFSAQGISLAQGDFFALDAADLRGVKAVYDRACLIALPPPMRAQYVEKLRQIMEPGTQILLITIDHQESRAEGPPFAVHPTDVDTLFSHHNVKRLSERVVPVDNPKLKEFGLMEVSEEAYLIHL